MDERLADLLDAFLDDRLTIAETAELRRRLSESPEARRAYWECIEQHALIQDVLAESRGQDLALLDEPQPPGRCAVDEPEPATARPVRRSPWLRIAAVSALAALLAIAAGVWRFAGGDRPPGPAAGDAPEPAAVATVAALSGDVRVIDRSGASAEARPGALLFAGQVLRVGDDESRVEVLFGDGTQVALGAGTDLRLPAAGVPERRTLHLERGAIQVQAPAKPADAPLVFTTDQAQITAKAGRFRVYREENSSRMEVEEGKARVDNLACDKSIDVADGSFVVVSGPQAMLSQALPEGRCRLRHTFLRAGDAAALSPDSATLVTSHFSKGWKVWNLRTGGLTSSAPGCGQRAGGLALTDGGKTAVALCGNAIAAFWKVGEPAAEQTPLRDRELRCSAVSADGRLLAQGKSRELLVWDANPEAGAISLRLSRPVFKPWSAAISSAGPQVAVGQWNGEIRVFDIPTAAELPGRKLNRTPAALALSSDARFLAAYANTDGLVLFDRSGEGRRTLWPGQGARVSDIRFSADGRVLLAGLDDGTVRAWSVADGSVLLVLETGHRHVSRVLASADLSVLVTVGDNDCVKVWDCRLS